MYCVFLLPLFFKLLMNKHKEEVKINFLSITENEESDEVKNSPETFFSIAEKNILEISFSREEPS